MGTVIRPTVSNKNRYQISKHRYYELKHFCLQYPEWKDLYLSRSLYSRSFNEIKSRMYDSTADKAIQQAELAHNMAIIENTAIDTDPDLSIYIFKAVTEGVSYPYLQTVMDIPCGRDMFYERYRRFFWLLDQVRN